MDKQQVLEASEFGSQIAEDEIGKLSHYFVETEQWRKFYSGECDIVFGAKGSGKSALYSLLTSKKEEFRLGKRTIFLQAENPRGLPAFRDIEQITNGHHLSDDHFRSLWKIYFLSILAHQIRHQLEATKSINKECSEVIEALVSNGLLERNANLVSRLRAAWSYLRQILPSVEGGITDPGSGLKITGKITLGEPSPAQIKEGFISIDALLAKLNIGFSKQTITAWIVLDRLDVAFADSDALEACAIRSLFRVYLDMVVYSQFKVKIFLRDDIWKKVVATGFREASHITRVITLNWDNQSILNLIVNRLVSNEGVCGYYQVDPGKIMSDLTLQEEFFYKVFPRQVEKGPKKPKTLDWMLTRLADGTGRTAPREIIHLLNAAREMQLNNYRLGKRHPDDGYLIDNSPLQEALPVVSETRFKQTLCAEHPSLIRHLYKLEREKSEQNLDTLRVIWGEDEKDASRVADKLVDIGFFASRGTKLAPVFWVPYLYRDALKMVQGSAARKSRAKKASPDSGA
ncbi:P-loop ATPase, Sll1717 family [Variovorax sp. GB1R11]|uniref:P-loop ATPase, Sll1717 family n=1 Tax=Variovorax sp. GB1R11 TaxID=3443741 RepID=UPI003F47AA4F